MSLIDYNTLLDGTRLDIIRAAEMAASPHVHLRPSLSIDGNQWCALYGENLQDGIAGFGDTPESAMANFDYNFRHQLAKK